MVIYITGVAKSWVYWPMLAGAMFLYKYDKQKRAFEEAHGGEVALAWPISFQVCAVRYRCGTVLADGMALLGRVYSRDELCMFCSSYVPANNDELEVLQLRQPGMWLQIRRTQERKAENAVGRRTHVMHKDVP